MELKQTQNDMAVKVDPAKRARKGRPIPVCDGCNAPQGESDARRSAALRQKLTREHQQCNTHTHVWQLTGVVCVRCGVWWMVFVVQGVWCALCGVCCRVSSTLCLVCVCRVWWSEATVFVDNFVVS